MGSWWSVYPCGSQHCRQTRCGPRTQSTTSHPHRGGLGALGEEIPSRHGVPPSAGHSPVGAHPEGADRMAIARTIRRVRRSALPQDEKSGQWQQAGASPHRGWKAVRERHPGRFMPCHTCESRTVRDPRRGVSPICHHWWKNSKGTSSRAGEKKKRTSSARAVFGLKLRLLELLCFLKIHGIVCF